ncbi:MAG: hemerythrin family protein [Clostridium sp.]|nr:hemerythrin family protein [Clostridium sp.]
MYAEFTDDLLTGNETIDTQHKELISKINDLLVSCEERSNQSGAARMLNFLADYTEFHFQAEEALQKAMGYPGLKEHMEKHEELRTTVQELHEMLTEEEGPTDAFVEKVSEKVRDWLFYHIQTFDRSVAEYKFMRDNAERI